jgi:hypothetical protein
MHLLDSQGIGHLKLQFCDAADGRGPSGPLSKPRPGRTLNAASCLKAESGMEGMRAGRRLTENGCWLGGLERFLLGSGNSAQ